MNSCNGPCPDSVRAWTNLLRAEHAVRSAVEAQLKQAGYPPLSWYAVLMELDAAPEGRLRPFELEQRIAFKQYNLSRLVARLSEEGLVQTAQCPNDARGHHVQITAAGRALKSAMWPAYAQAIDKHFSGKLAAGEAEQLAQLLERVLR